MHFLEPQFQNFLREAPGPPIKDGPPSTWPDKTTAHLFIVIVCCLFKVTLPLLPIFGRTLYLRPALHLLIKCLATKLQMNKQKCSCSWM